MSKVGWSKLIQSKRTRSDFANINFNHPASRLLRHYKHNGAPVRFHSPPWTNQQIHRAMHRGPHKSCHEHISFLEEEFIDMINKDQWMILPYKNAKSLPGLRISPPGVIPQRGRRPRWICDYSFYGVNDDTLPLAPQEAMQFGHALDRYLRELLLADPANGPLYMLKLDISDGFYRVALAPQDIPKLGVVFPTREGEEPLVAFPLVLPMGWKNSPPIFSAATETAADLANHTLQHQPSQPPHPLDAQAASMDERILSSPHYAPQHHQRTSTTESTTTSTNNRFVTSAPACRDPCLPKRQDPVSYVDVFVDDFISICQGNTSKSQVRKALLHAVDKVFRPNDNKDNTFRREPVSIKKLKQGDCSWHTNKLILGWIINTVAMTISLPAHRQQRLADILASIPKSQKRISIKKWHKILGELRSMSLALPGSRGLFSAMQKALATSTSKRVALRKGVHNALHDFKWMSDDISSRPTRIAELIPLLPSALGYHDASGQGAGGVWFPTDDLCPRQGSKQSQPLLWRLQWPKDISSSLVSEKNPSGTISISDLELAGGLLHLDIIAQCFDVRERTVLSKTDNLATLYWQRKGSTTTEKAPAHLLRLLGIHQRTHRYVPRHDYIPGKSNPLADDASRLFHLSDSQFFSHFTSTYPKPNSYRLVTPMSKMTSAVISALRTKTCNVASLQGEPPPTLHIGTNGSSSHLDWASTPFSRPSAVKSPFSKFSSEESEPVDPQPADVKSSLARLRSTYGALRRRTSQWGPRTPALTTPVMSTFGSNACSNAMPKPTPLQIGSNQSPSKSFAASCKSLTLPTMRCN